ncbi:MAG TPA: cytochrome P450 [Amycolatopsis sp.]|nr:cytochrome P450 [Amycolatopsis sp.]
MSSPLDFAGLALADPEVYADEHRLHRALTLLRNSSPVHWVSPPGYRPFWAITKHSDVLAIAGSHERFLNAPRPVLTTTAMERSAAECRSDLRTLIHLDGPDHRALRTVGTGLFRPHAQRSLLTKVSELAKHYVDRMIELGGTCDFVTDIAEKFPPHVILSALGVPRADRQWILDLTKEMRGSDPRRFAASQEELFDYFRRMASDRVSAPVDDLASAIATARVDGERLSDRDITGFYVSIATAGHDTLSAALSGGLHALIENPDQLARLRRNPELMPRAVDEMIRWVTPTKSFMRTATEDYELRGVTIRAGESVQLNYASANRDEDVFVDPFLFDVERTPNRHLSFGAGVHYCLGASFAKSELRTFFAQLLPRLRAIRLTGKPVLVASTFVGGLETLPIEYGIAR